MRRFAALLLLLAACDGARRDPVVAPSAGISLGGKKIDVTVVATEKDRRHALPRLSPPTETQAYLLAWPRERFMKIESEGSRVSFDVAFLDKSGAIVDLQPLKAQDREGLVPKSPAAYALLLMPGLPAKLGVKAGDKASLSAEVLAVKVEELPQVRINGISANVELSVTEAERQHGLMFRPRMAPEDGMLFAYAGEGGRSFWMANTMIPLDIAFFADDGTLLNVNETPMYSDPRNPGSNYATSDSKGPARFVLEMNLGWFKQKGIVDGSGRVLPGTKAEIPADARKDSE